MESWQKNLWVLWIGSFMTSSSFSMVVPFLPLFLLQIGVHHHVELWSGALFSVAFLCGAIMSPIWGSLADKYGRKPMIIRSGFVLFVVYALTAFVQNPWEVLALRALQGLLSGYIPSAIALIGTNTPETRVGYALAMMSTATASGGILGPLFGGGIARLFDNRVAFASASILVLSSTLLALFLVTEDQFVPSKTRSSVIEAFRIGISNKGLFGALILSMLTAFSIMTIEPVLPLYIVNLGGSLKNASLLAGIVFSLAGVANVIFGPRWGRLADSKGFRLVLLVGLFGGAMGNFLQIPFHNIWAFSVVRFLYGAFFCAVFPAINGLVVMNTQSDFRGRAFGLNQTSNQVGTMFGPMIGGVIGGAFGVHSVFALTGLLMFVTFAVAWFGTRKTPVQASGEAVSVSNP